MGQVTTKQYLEMVQQGIEKELTANASALPEGFNKQRFELNCIATLKDNLENWNGKRVETIAAALAKGAYLGLDFFNGECYAIPYKKDVQFQTSYKGEIKLCKRYSSRPIKDIYAKNVRRGDFFEEKIENGAQSVSFRPRPFSDEEIIGTFAVILFEDGGMIYDTMSVAEIEKIRHTFSKAPDSPAWTKSPGEMYKKTVLRRVCKMIDLDFENSAQQQAFTDGGDFDASKASEREEEPAPAIDPFADGPDSDGVVADIELDEIDITNLQEVG